eukprot:5209502-Lingulodinium_polyedra.AAC.1
MQHLRHGSTCLAWALQHLHPPSADEQQSWVEQDRSLAAQARSAPGLLLPRSLPSFRVQGPLPAR